ncbi:GNAT family N-acetyltransferase [Mesobacillus jeotgali]|uniref:GNAT family N-acetyltransferase n=1 Tax=Mesobacillus jeotgali TaxID=129985 RepID=UPI0009A73BBD|nr:GNAT family N-acetyltransferase [Mesobacillus jeotgali]
MIIAKKGTVSLQFYKSEFRSSLLSDYVLLDQQRRFTALPGDALEKCDEDPDRHPVVIFYENVPAGFFVLHGWEGVKDYTENQTALLLRAYSINLPYQGKGIATASIKLLKPFVKGNFPSVNEIILTVNQSNITAQTVYKRGGFVDRGERVMGREGEMFIYHLNL